MRIITVLAVLILTLGMGGCARSVRLSPGRDAYYQVTTQTTPAQAQGSPTITVSLESDSPGSSYQTLSTTGIQALER